MNPRRMIDRAPNSVEAQLLRAGRSMQPPARTYDKTLASLGIISGALGGTSLASAAGTTSATSTVANAAAGALASTGAKTFAAGLFGSVALKGVAVGLVAGAMAIGAARVGVTLNQSVYPKATITATRDQAESPVTRSPSVTHPDSPRIQSESLPARSASAPMQFSGAGQLGTNNETVRSRELPHAIPEQKRVRAHVSDWSPLKQQAQNLKQANPARDAHDAQLTGHESLGAEVALIDQAKRALEHRQAEQSLALLDEHRARFAAPKMGEEASFLRARALQILGRHAAAAGALQEFRRAYPDSTLSEQPE